MTIVRFAPGLRPVLKYDPSQPRAADGKWSTSGGSSSGLKVVDGKIGYNGLEARVPLVGVSPNDEVAWRSEAETWQALRAVAGEDWCYWNGNYPMRVASARIMGIEGGFAARGEGRGTGTDLQVEAVLRGDVPGSAVFGAGRGRAEARLSKTAVLMDASTSRVGDGQPLYRGIRLADGDPRLSAKPGDEFVMPLSSFATRPALAQQFLSGAEVAGETSSSDRANPVLITVRPGARGARNGELDPNPVLGLGEEVVSQGRYRVVENMPTLGGSTRNLILEHVAYYDIATGTWVDNDG